MDEMAEVSSGDEETFEKSRPRKKKKGRVHDSSEEEDEDEGNSCW